MGDECRPTFNPESKRSYADVFVPTSVPAQMISVKVENGETFCLHKNVLLQDSAYFKKALDGPFLESQTNSIDLDDIPAKHFGIYVGIVYSLALHGTNFKLRDAGQHIAFRHWCPKILTLWRLGDRFLNDKVTTLAETELYARLILYSVDFWKRIYERSPEADLKKKMHGLQIAFQTCEEHYLPLEKYFVKAASNAPPQVFAELVDDLEDPFRSEVMKAFALRFADPVSTARKRRFDKKREQEQGKKLKMEQ